MIVAFTSLSPAGATFMDWSWQWLKGSDSTWNKGQGWIPMINDPIKVANAHRYQKNHPLGVKEWEKFIESAENESHDNDISFYPSFQNTQDNLDDFVDHMNKLIDRKIRVVIIQKTQAFPYHTARSDSSKSEVDFWLDVNPDLAGEKIQKVREMFSIRMVPQQKKWLSKIASAFKRLDKDVIVVTDNEWAHQTEETMLRICDGLGTGIDKDRLTSWRTVMAQWQNNYKKTESFYENDIPEMADKIISGEPMDLRPYNLRLVEESLLMMYVMKRHGRRLVLPDDDFPQNTQDLHQFLN